MWSSDSSVISKLLNDHAMLTRVFITSGVTGAVTEVSIGEDSECSADLGNQVARTATLAVDRSYISQGLFNPISDTVTIINEVPGVGTIPIFVGRPNDYSEKPNGAITVNCVDFADDVVNDDFIVPWSVDTTQYVTSTMTQIIQDVNLNFGVTIDAATPITNGSTNIFDGRRGDALEQLAKSIQSFWITDRSGGFRIFPNPYSLLTGAIPVSSVMLTDGQSGVIVDIQPVTSRNGIQNSITVISERTDGTPPIRVTVQDTNAISPTRYGGPLGKRNANIRNDSILSVFDAIQFGQQALNAKLALTRTWSISLPHCPLFDPGDVITCSYNGEPTAQVIIGVKYNLAANRPTQLSTRQLTSVIGSSVAS